jgi:hypothetical protein
MDASRYRIVQLYNLSVAVDRPEDMADDAMSVLDALGWDSAHVVAGKAAPVINTYLFCTDVAADDSTT